MVEVNFRTSEVCSFFIPLHLDTANDSKDQGLSYRSPPIHETVRIVTFLVHLDIPVFEFPTQDPNALPSIDIDFSSYLSYVELTSLFGPRTQ